MENKILKMQNKRLFFLKIVECGLCFGKLLSKGCRWVEIYYKTGGQDSLACRHIFIERRFARFAVYTTL